MWNTEPEQRPPLVGVGVQPIGPQGLGERWPFSVVLHFGNQSRQKPQYMVDGDLLYIPAPEED